MEIGAAFLVMSAIALAPTDIQQQFGVVVTDQNGVSQS
jgi:hypothetical protein